MRTAPRCAAVGVIVACVVAVVAALAAPLPPDEAGSARVARAAARAESLNVAGRYAAAESLAAAALAEPAAERAPDSLRGRLLDARVNALLSGGRYYEDRTLELAREAVQVNERALGGSGNRVARSLTNLGWVLYRRGAWQDALAPVDRAMSVAARAGGDSTIASIRAIHLRAGLAEEAADYAAAEQLYQRELRATLAVFGDSTAQVANTLNSIGILHRKWGHLPEARRMLERALALREARLGPVHVDVAISCTNLGNALTDLGDMAAAARQYERAIAVFEAAAGPRHPALANAWLGLGNTRLVRGDTTAALVAYRAGRSVVEASRGADSPQAALMLVMEGQVLAAHGDFDSALVAIGRSLDIRRRVLGESHPQTALSHFGLGEAWRGRGDPVRAAASFDTALAIWERAGLANDPNAIEALTALARTQLANGRADDAMTNALRADSLVRSNVSRHVRALEDRLALAYSDVQMKPLDVAMSLLAGGAVAGRAAEAWDALVGDRTQILDEMALRRHVVATRGDGELRALADSLASAREALSRLALRGATAGGAESASAREAERRVDQLEAAIAGRSAAFRNTRDAERAGLDRVRAALRADDALVSFVRFARDTGGMATRDAYAALACVGPRGAVRCVSLGDAAPIDAAIRTWRAEASRAPGPLTRGRDEARCREAGARVRRAVWDPVALAVHGAQRVFVVPAGEIHGVDFAALPVGAREYLVERAPLVHRLTSERDLLPPPAADSSGSGLLAMGGADYEAAETAPAPSAAPPVLAAASSPPPQGAASSAVFRGAQSACEELRSLHFAPLGGSRAEAEALGALWDRAAAGGRAEVRLGGAASEARLKAQAAGHRVLHLATHGFFVARACGARAGALPENPLLRCGLALAGANHRDDAAPGAEDGVLTAEEAGSLPLEGTDWVVLSACESGLGDTHAAEGVLGLQRAFRVAGARTVITSLWPVGDETTRRWMANLYAERLGAKASTAEAVRRASLTLLRARRAQGLDTHPHGWAGFVAAGDWR